MLGLRKKLARRGRAVQQSYISSHMNESYGLGGGGGIIPSERVFCDTSFFMPRLRAAIVTMIVPANCCRNAEERRHECVRLGKASPLLVIRRGLSSTRPHGYSITDHSERFRAEGAPLMCIFPFLKPRHCRSSLPGSLKNSYAVIFRHSCLDPNSSFDMILCFLESNEACRKLSYCPNGRDRAPHGKISHEV